MGQGYVLEIFGVCCPIDLISIPIGDVSLIAEMDWLIYIGAIIEYEGQRVVVRTLSGGELVIYGEGTKIGSASILFPGLECIFSTIVWVILPM